MTSKASILSSFPCEMTPIIPPAKSSSFTNYAPHNNNLFILFLLGYVAHRKFNNNGNFCVNQSTPQIVAWEHKLVLRKVYYNIYYWAPNSSSFLQLIHIVFLMSFEFFESLVRHVISICRTNM